MMGAMSQPRRGLFIALGLLVCLLLAASAAWLLCPRSAITPANAERIKAGMTLAEVETILGGPAQNANTGPIVYDATVGRVDHSGPPGDLRIWQSDRVQLTVIFRDDVVTHIRPLPVHRVEETPLDILRRWLGL
jgi:hypothetical protein